MKRLITFIMTLLTIVVMSSFVFTGNGRENRSLETLWRKYEKAQKEDRVQDMADLLEDLKAVSLKERKPLDYFRACDEYVNVSSRRNWKLTDSLISNAEEELRGYGLPVLEILFDLRHGRQDDSVRASIIGNEAALKKAKTRELYGNVLPFNSFDEYFNMARFHTVENDYEYILWAARHYRGFGGGWPYGMLEEYYGDRYPVGPYVRFLSATSGFDRDKIESQLKKLAGEYAGRGIGMLAEDELFPFRFDALKENPSSEGYLKLREEIRDFRKRCSQLKGDDGTLAGFCLTAKALQNQLEDKYAGVKVEDGKARVLFRNTGKVMMKVRNDDRVIYETEVVNDVNSFYRMDTVEVELPVLDDGEYNIELDAKSDKVRIYSYEKYTLSLAGRFAADGMCVYAADYLTGKPVEKADLVLYDMDMNKVAEYEGFDFKGFTTLPKELYPFSGDKARYLKCRYEKDGIVHWSRRLRITNRTVETVGGMVPSLEAVIFKDRGAFVPGDTVKFKAVLYRTHSDGTADVLPAGREVKVKLIDPERNTVGQLLMKTNEYGAVSGSFAIDGNSRNGIYMITVHEGASGIRTVASSSLRVDEFILPSYDLSFDEPDELYFPGDTVKVTGKVRNYSGHGFGGLRASALIHLNSAFYAEKPVVIASDGSFEVEFAAGDCDDEYVDYNVEVRLTDSTGETLEFSCSSSLSAAISLYAEPVTKDAGNCWLDGSPWNGISSALWVLSGRNAEFLCKASLRWNAAADILLDYEVRGDGKTVSGGKVRSGDTLSVDMSSMASGVYELELKVVLKNSAGKEIKSKEICRFLYLPETEDVMPCEADRMFRTRYEDGTVILQLGTGNGPLWAVVELFGEGQVPLKKDMVYLSGVAGKPGSLVTLKYPHIEGYSDNLSLSVFYFRNGENYRHEKKFRRPAPHSFMPLSFASFTDETIPGQECRISFRTDSRAEVLASVYDVSSDKIHANVWNAVNVDRGLFDVSVSYSAANGCNGGDEMYMIGYGARAGNRLKYRRGTTGNSGAVYGYGSPVSAETFVNYEQDAVMSKAASPADVEVRDDFATTLAFEPFMRPGKDGIAEMKFRTSGKLSTFKIMAFAHDKAMNNSLISREMLVTLPVKVSVFEPQYLYAGDECVMRVSVSNAGGAGIKGKVCFYMYDREEYIDVEPVGTDSVDVIVPVGGSSDVGFDVVVPDGVGSLGFKVIFVGHEYSSDPAVAVNEAMFSDGLFVSVPVYPDEQVLTEAHSAVLLDGESADELVEELRKKFVNVSSVGAEYSERTLEDLFKEAVPGVVEPESDNAISLSEALSVNVLAYGLHDGHWGLEEDGDEALECIGEIKDIVRELVKCARADGGFGWFEGMPSSPMVTAVVLEHCRYIHPESLAVIFDVMDVAGLEDEFDKTLEKAVKYLDSSYFGEKDRPYWYGRLSMEQYLSVRSQYADVPFDKEAAVRSVGKKGYKNFQKEVRAYLTPRASGRKTEGMILSKVRKIRILEVLPDALADAWGLKLKKKMEESGRIEKESLKQYAVRHPSGGIYYPNAVMPWRGLLEGEAYAHAMIGELAMWLAALENDQEWAEIARGISIWTMLQKETQEWSSDPGFVEALSLVNNNIGMVKNVKVIRLSKRFVKPFDEIKAAGNGFKVEVDYYKAGADGARVRLSEGDSLHVGDKITAVYSLWSAENRSHVRLSVPRAACFRPAEQLSGWSGGWFRPLSYGFMTISPYSYREVKADRTLYWIDVFPEEKTTMEEELFVIQEGVFTTPAAEIESLYAPHYRANDAGGYSLRVKKLL